MKALWIASAAIAGALVAGCTTAAVEDAAPQAPSFTAALNGSPGVTTSGAGKGVFTLDPATKVLTYSIEYTGLTGDAMAAHIHGPAEPGANAGVVVPFASAASPITGTATLTDEQIADLMAGKYYVNIHTAANRGGEIRGQILK